MAPVDVLMTSPYASRTDERSGPLRQWSVGPSAAPEPVQTRAAVPQIGQPVTMNTTAAYPFPEKLDGGKP